LPCTCEFFQHVAPDSNLEERQPLLSQKLFRNILPMPLNCPDADAQPVRYLFRKKALPHQSRHLTLAMDRNIWVRTPDRRTARPPDPPRQHPGDEWRKLPPWPEQGASSSAQNLNLNQHRLALTVQSIRTTASYITSAAARMLALVFTLIIPNPKWQHFALPFGSLLLCR